MTSPIIVADSSPLIALAIIEQLELLPRLYRHVLAPPTVWHEVTVQGAGLPGALAVSQVNWLDIRVPDPASVEPFEAYRLQVLLASGEQWTIDLAPLIQKRDAYWRLRQDRYFRQVAIDPLGALCWPEGEDLAPESLARYRYG